MAVLEGACAGAAAVTMMAWNAVVSERQTQGNRRSASEGVDLRKRCERLLRSAQVTPTISTFDGSEGAESSASIGSGDIVDQAPMLSPSCAAESCWEGGSSEASPSPHMYRELVVLEGPPLSPLPHMLPELPEDVDYTVESVNATTLSPGGCDLSPDFHLCVPSPPRFGLHHRRHTISGNRPRTFSEYTPGCLGNSSDDGDSSLKHQRTGQEKMEATRAAAVLTRVEEVERTSRGRGCTRGRARYATYSNGDVLRKLGDAEPFANDGLAVWPSGTGEDTFRSRRNGVSDVGGGVFPVS